MTQTITQPLEDVVLEPFFVGSMSLPPGLNKSYRIGKFRSKNKQTGEVSIHRRIIATEELEQFKADAHFELTKAMQNYSLINAIRDAKNLVPLGVILHLHLPPVIGRVKKKDIDGVIKASQDAAFLKMELDDELVDDLHIVKYRDSLNPRIDIEVRCLLSATNE